ncbi:MAG: hypothetical protein COU10_01290 [Candidatus Harrisonbacteria bacterium CG10_big_fil_rev_8_21_14_0_10_45_28]|uniref:Uncharacterized protein n=1 Tax=Candidatus Harrisonbacteria bacterium CG10_big_fil_rev_8_21_14_0_10_45_28 TaxID=1974586 RepID=A0A2H0UQH5_9BACT|nr:MAG: hypothetical protein COU10_01290 [Candidatus Harrisonbacteria bacterium CG10_big_fil_rev_8_21_14_0_10_45_28]
MGSAGSIIGIIEVAMPIIFFVWLLVFLILGFILKYHWRRYGVEIPKSKKIAVIYFIVGFVLLAGMLASYIYFVATTR